MGYPKTLYVQHVTAEFFGRAWEERPAGYAVRYDMHDDEAQAEIARLQAEVDRLTDFIRHIGKVNGEMNGGMVVVAKSEIAAAWNDAIEQAASLFTHPDEEGIADRIRDLKR